MCSFHHSKICNLIFLPFEILDYFVTTFIYLLLLPSLCERTFALPSIKRIAVIFKIINTFLLEFYLQFQKIFVTDSNGNLTLFL